jgi:hypothetical protein
MLGSSWAASQLADSQEGLSSMSEWRSVRRTTRTGPSRPGIWLDYGDANMSIHARDVETTNTATSPEGNSRSLGLFGDLVILRCWCYDSHNSVKKLNCPCAWLINHYAMKAYGGMEVQLHIFLTSALVAGEWLASCPGRFTPGKETPLPIGYEIGWTPEPVWTTWRRENSWPYRDSNSDS